MRHLEQVMAGNGYLAELSCQVCETVLENPNEGNHRTLVTVCGESFLDMPIVGLFGLAFLTM